MQMKSDAHIHMYLIKCDNKWCFPTAKQFNGLARLWLEAVHDVDDENSEVTQGRTATTQITATQHQNNFTANTSSSS